MEYQLNMFTSKARLVRKNQYEVSHCTNCGCLVPERILIGLWPHLQYNIRYCPNCGAEFEDSKENDYSALKKGWYWEMHSFDGKF